MNKKYLTADNVIYELANLKQLTFEVTDACNLSCSYCAYGEFYNDYDARHKNKMDLPAAIKLIDHLAALWNSPYNVSLQSNVYISFYGGEPLMNMPFIEAIVDHVGKLDCPHRGFTFSMTTNGILLDRHMDYLAAHHFNLLISLDGDSSHNAYRVSRSGKPSYDTIVKNVGELQRRYPDYFEKRVNFNSVLHNRNSVEGIYTFFKAKFGKIPSIGELNSVGIRPDKVELFRQTYRNATESLHQAENYEKIEQDMFMKSATYRSVTTFIHQYSGFVFRDYTDLLLAEEKKTVPTGTCIPFSKKMYVTVNGKILPCERIGQQYGLGEITPDGVNLDPEAIAEKYNAYLEKLERQCTRCHTAKSCIQCIFNLDDLDGTPICYGFMNKERFEQYKATQMNFLRKNPTEYHRIMEEVIIE